MRAAEAAAVDPAEDLLREFQDTFSARLDTMVRWEEAANSSTNLVALDACKLALTKMPLGYRLSAIFMGSPLPGPDSAPAALIERGRRVLKHGALLDLQELAIRLIRRGVRGGPAYQDEPPAWSLVPLDGSLRMTVPGGELRITPIARRAGSVIDDPDSPCTLTFENRKGAYVIARDTGAILKDSALEIWDLQKTRRALQIRLNGKCVNLRTASVPGVLGYHAVAERTFIVLAWVEDELGLYYLDGRHFARLTQLTLADVRNGEPPDVDALLHTCVTRTAGGEHDLAEPSANEPHADLPGARADTSPHQAGRNAGGAPRRSAREDRFRRTGEGIHDGPAPAAAHTLMPQWQLDLCQRYLKRLYGRLRGRGARKARELVRVVHDAIGRCRSDISGSRREVHELLEQMLEISLAGGDRNIRDCLDLLARESPLFLKDGHHCSIVFSQLHDPGSELIRRIAEDEAMAHGQTSAPTRTGRATEAAATPTAPHPPRASSARPVASDPVPTPPPEAASRPAEPVSASPTPATQTALHGTAPAPGHASAPVTTPTGPSSAPSPTAMPAGVATPAGTAPWAPDLGPYRVLSAPAVFSPTAAVPASQTSVGISSLFTASPHAPMTGLIHDDPDDPYDPTMEALNAPSRTLLASRQKPSRPGDDTQGSS